MKFLDEFRDAAVVRTLIEQIHANDHAALDHHGGLRRADPHHRPLRAR